MQVELSEETFKMVEEYRKKVKDRLGFAPSPTNVVNGMTRQGIRHTNYEIDTLAMHPLKHFKKKSKC